MSDPLDRAVDAQIDAHRPDIVPPFAAIEARKRSRDRRRMALGAGALSVAALAVVAVPSLDGGGDRLVPGQVASGVSQTAFEVRYAAARTSETKFDAVDAALARCLALPGARDEAVPVMSNPPAWVVTVEGTAAQAATVRECLSALPEAKVRTVPEADPADRQVTFFVSSGGGDAAAYTAGVKKCLALPGVSGSSVQESYPAAYKMSASGAAAAGTLADCLAVVPRAEVEVTGDDPAAGAGLDAFINRCVGGETPQPAPEYVGLTEQEATRTKQPVSAETINVVRVVGRDGGCLGRTKDLRSDRVNLLIANGKVVWAGRF